MPHPSNPPSSLYQDRNIIPDAYRFNQKPSHYYIPTDFPVFGTCVRDVTEIHLLTSPHMMWVHVKQPKNHSISFTKLY